MRISLKVEYACRVLAQLGRIHGTGKLAHIEQLAEIENVPPNYLVQILNELRNGGLINSKRGKMGGYALANAPEDITLLSVVLVIDPEMIEAQPGTLGQSGIKVSSVWQTVSSRLESELAKHTLRDFMPDDASDLYYI